LMLYLNNIVSYEQKNLFKNIFGKKKNVSCNIPKQLKQEIVAELKPDLLELRNKYNFDFKSWNIEV
ncbi:MAG: hypothetical protein AAFY63_01015, partial [Cyanobacteria bacterium J06643_13]